jgi:hypothetical protein
MIIYIPLYVFLISFVFFVQPREYTFMQLRGMGGLEQYENFILNGNWTFASRYYTSPEIAFSDEQMWKKASLQNGQIVRIYHLITYNSFWHKTYIINVQYGKRPNDPTYRMQQFQANFDCKSLDFQWKISSIRPMGNAIFQYVPEYAGCNGTK